MSWRDELEEYGFDNAQIEAFLKLRSLVSAKKVKTVEDVEEVVGYGLIDKATLRDTFLLKE